MGMGGGITSQCVFLLKNSRLAPFWSEFFCARAKRGYIRGQLQTIHKNPGPKTIEGKDRRRERRKQHRKSKHEVEDTENRMADVKVKREKFKIVTWNTQGMSTSERNRRKCKSIVKYSADHNWDAVLLTELRSETDGVIWLGEEDELSAIIHGKKSGILIRGEILDKWCEEGQSKRCGERSTAIRSGSIMLVSTYMPVDKGTNREELEKAKEELTEMTSWKRKEDIMIIGGDFNAHIGREVKNDTCGKYGLRSSNRQGEELMEWLRQNGLVYANSYYGHKRRGTFFSLLQNRWYELDGFLMQNSQRGRHVEKISTVEENSLSDHKPKKMIVKWKKDRRRRQQTKRAEKIAHEKLKVDEIAARYKSRIEEEIEKTITEKIGWDNVEVTHWDDLTETMMRVAKETCGVQEKKIENPWMLGRDEEINKMREDINVAIRNRNEARENKADEEVIARTREELRQARGILRRKTKSWENEWWDEIINECRDAGDRNDQGTMYKQLKKIGMKEKKKEPETSKLTKEDFRGQFKSVSEDRFETKVEDIFAAVDRAVDLRGCGEHDLWQETMDETPGYAEIMEQMKKMKDSAPGADGVRLRYILGGGDLVKGEVVRMVQFMFENEADCWEQSLKKGQVIPLYKKGNRNDPGNYRGICLLSMGSRILARVMANRVRIWAEKLGLLDDNQAGFRTGRSTADVTQLMNRLQEDTLDMNNRYARSGSQMEPGRQPVARLLDLRKAYPRVNKPALWRLLDRYGMRERALRTLKALHECTSYTVRSREGESEAWIPARGLREGCPSSPPLFNIYHQAVMRAAAEDRRRAAGGECGIKIKWVPGSNFPSEKSYEKYNSEALEVRVDMALFADDTTGLGYRAEMDGGMEEIKKVMGNFEEKNNDDKEEEIVFGTQEGGKIRVLGSYLSNAEDVKQRTKRGGNTWFKLKRWLKKSKLSKKRQAKIVEACVESTMLFDCQARPWKVNETKKLQQIVDKCYRHIWARKNKPPTMEMQEKEVNMYDLRKELGVNSIRSKIEKRSLERLGHIMRMEDNRTVKAAALGWMEELENVEKTPGKKPKTQLYWRKLVKEAGIDPTKIGEKTKDRKQWKKIVKTRVEKIHEYEDSKRKKYVGEEKQRNQYRRDTEDDLVCGECGKKCKSKAGLTNHRRLIHEKTKGKKVFKCGECGDEFQREANLVNHKKACVGMKTANSSMKQCDKCRKEITKPNWARHIKKCKGESQEEAQQTARTHKRETAACEKCDKEIAKTNMARHRKTCTGRLGVGLDA